MIQASKGHVGCACAGKYDLGACIMSVKIPFDAFIIVF